MTRYLIISFIFLLTCFYHSVSADNISKSKLNSSDIALSFIKTHQGSVTYDKYMTKDEWNYEQGVILEALRQMFVNTGDYNYFHFIKNNIEQYVNDKGEIRSYKYLDFNVDNINTGRQLLFLYQLTGEEKYKIAADTLRQQIENQPRNPSGGFWHKKIYPNQMWLDGLYMLQPFYAQYSVMFNNSQDFEDIYKNFTLIFEKTYDSSSGLLYHAWDESKVQKWADPVTGRSPNFWGRAMGWYMMALVDVLDFFPGDMKERNDLIKILKLISGNLIRYQDKKSSMWFQVVDKAGKEGNYLETSASAMFGYAFAKSVNKGYLDKEFLKHAKNIFNGIINKYVTYEKDGSLILDGTCRAAGLGGNPYRDGSYEYYISEKPRLNDFKGYGPFLMLAIELEIAEAIYNTQINIGLDYYYNNEYRTDKSGKKERFHYIWEDTTNSGFSDLAKIFINNKSKLFSIKSFPEKKELKKMDVYIIVDPDTEKETEKPNYLDEKAIENIYQWVINGGVLLLFSNDVGNCEFEKFNNLTAKFGFRFNEVSLNQVKNNYYETGAINKLPYHPLFYGVNKIFMKEISSVSADSAHYGILKKGNDIIILIKKIGKGNVIAVTDPWLYNEYIAGRRLPPDFKNNVAAENLAKVLKSLVYQNRISAKIK